MLAAVLTIVIACFIIYMALAKAAGKDKYKDEYKWIEQRKKEEQEPWKYCDDYCYRCEVKNTCERSESKED